MRGGLRNGAGRKTKPNSEKKVGRKFYLSDQQFDAIMNLEIDGATTFSQKCVALLEKGMHACTPSAEEVQSGENLVKMQARECVESCRAERLEQGKTCQAQFCLDNNLHETERSETLTFIDLFAGIGGIRKGFEDEHTKCVFSSEWDKYAAKTYEANYGETPHGDITKISENDIPDHDVLLAGFPCQPFSHIGRREGFAHETQGTLFFDVVRILKAKQPKMFLLENVKGLVTIDGGKTFEIITKTLKALNYNVFYEILDAQNFGLPQRRERIVIVGFRSDLNIEDFSFPCGDTKHRTPIKNILEHKVQGYTISKHLQNSYLFKKNDGKPQMIDLDSELQVNTLCASYHKIQRLTGTFIYDGETGVRMFSELECKRLMGFPDDFIVPVSKTQMYRQFGNSVAVPMIKEVADAMKKALRTKYPAHII